MLKIIVFTIIINNIVACKYAKNIHIKSPHIKEINRNLKNYDVSKVDWESVISGCHASFNYEKRLANFYIRGAAHDALAIHNGLGGSDGSVLLTQDELSRPENNYDSFTYKLSKNALALSKRFGTSVADIIAVCGAYAVTYLGGPVIINNNTNNTILVGRIDTDIPNPANQLVPADANTDLFNKYSIKFNFTLEEFTALLGSHTVIDDKTCLNRDQKTYCDPLIESCKNISMFIWDNTYYKDLCNKNIVMEENSFSINTKLTKLQHIKNNLCKFTSKKFKDKIKQDMEAEDQLNVNEILGLNTDSTDNFNTEVDPVKPVNPVKPVEPIELVEPVKPVKPVKPIEPVELVEPVKPVKPIDPIRILKNKLNIDNNINKVLKGKDNPNDLFNDEEILFREKMRVTVFEDNTHKLWHYTVNDAWLGQACQNKLNDTSYNKEIRKSMLNFQNNTESWNTVYIRAYNKMINNNANWINGKGFAITGLECYSGYKLYNNKKICSTAFLPNDSFYE